MLLERGYGTPPQALHLTGQLVAIDEVAAQRLSDQEPEQALALVSRLALPSRAG